MRSTHESKPAVQVEAAADRVRLAGARRSFQSKRSADDADEGGSLASTPRVAAQRERIEAAFGDAIQREASQAAPQALPNRAASRRPSGPMSSAGKKAPANSQSAVVQREVAEPVYHGGTHATIVELDLKKGDTLADGTKPSADIDGWDELRALGLTQGADNDHAWVKFHVLNQKAGGSGDDAGNLTPATQTANHDSQWNALEKNLKGWVDPEHRHGSGAPADAKFHAVVDYYGSDDDASWTDGAKTIKAKGKDYPKAVKASLQVSGGKEYGDKNYTANLSGSANGLLTPSAFTPPGWHIV